MNTTITTSMDVYIQTILFSRGSHRHARVSRSGFIRASEERKALAEQTMT